MEAEDEREEDPDSNLGYLRFLLFNSEGGEAEIGKEFLAVLVRDIGPTPAAMVKSLYGIGVNPANRT